MDEIQFACRDAFSLLLVPIISRAVKQCPVSPCTLLGKAGDTLVGECLGQGGKGFSLDWEELGPQRREENAVLCTSTRKHSRLVF